jgi:hypothetical protein
VRRPLIQRPGRAGSLTARIGTRRLRASGEAGEVESMLREYLRQYKTPDPRADMLPPSDTKSKV